MAHVGNRLAGERDDVRGQVLVLRLGRHGVGDRMREVGRLAALLARRRVDPGDLALVVVLAFQIPRFGLVGDAPDAVEEDQRLFLRERSLLDGVPRHRRVGRGKRFLVDAVFHPGEEILERGLRGLQPGRILVVGDEAEAFRQHLEVGARVGPVQDPVFHDALLHRLTGEIAQVVRGEFAGVHFGGQGGNLLVGLAHLAELVVVQEIHADLGILRHPVPRALVAHRLPEGHDDVAVELRVLVDVILEVERVTRFCEGPRPLVCQHEDVRTLVDGEGFQQVERVVVIALGVRLVELDLDALVGCPRPRASC